MSALSPAPAPTSGVRWTDLPTPLDSTDPSCCLSYKQSADLSPLCFHGLTNCFSRKPFVLITICVAPGCTPLVPSDAGCLGCSWGKPSVSILLRTLLRSCGSFVGARRLFSATYELFCKTPGVGLSPLYPFAASVANPQS